MHIVPCRSSTADADTPVEVVGTDADEAGREGVARGGADDAHEGGAWNSGPCGAVFDLVEVGNLASGHPSLPSNPARDPFPFQANPSGTQTVVDASSLVPS